MIHSKRPTKASIYFQLILWTFVMIAFATIAKTAYAGNGGYLVLAIIGNVIVNFLTANAHIYVIFPHFFSRKKYIMYFLSTGCLLFLSVVIKVFFVFIFNSDEVVTDHDPRETAPIIATLSTVFALFFSFLFRIIDNLVEKQQQEAALKEAQLMSELGFLRSQINPHSLFNILNTIYSMIYTGSKEAGNTVLKLSELMRYMLYETNETFIPITKELKYIQTYIELHTIKQKDKSTVQFDAKGITGDYEIPPLLLVPFIENAFKHGNWDSLDSKGWIKGEATMSKNELRFQLSNSWDETSERSDEPGGIGIENVQKRLELLLPNKHALSIDRTETTYSVELIIEINPV
ncbi:MAG: sensor histidine kinase [Crocinitomicaceae bacterium]